MRGATVAITSGTGPFGLTAVGHLLSRGPVVFRFSRWMRRNRALRPSAVSAFPDERLLESCVAVALVYRRSDAHSWWRAIVDSMNRTTRREVSPIS